MTIAIAGASASCREQIIATLAAMAEPLVEVVELPASAESSAEYRIDAVIAVLGDDRGTWELQLEDFHFEGQRPAILAAIKERAGAAVRQALRAGAADVFFLPADVADLSRCLVRVVEAHQDDASERTTVCALGSVAGGVGVSTLTVALGLALRRLTQKRVALVDLGMQSGALAALLDLNPEHTMSELADPTNTIDSLRLEASLAAHASGLYLLAAPKRIEESEMVSADSMLAVLAVMKELFDFILIDCGHHMSELLVTVWEHSTHLLYPVEQSLSSVRPAQRFLDMFGRLDLEHLAPQFLLNRYDSSNPFTVAKIEAALRQEVTLRIPRDDEAFVQFQLGPADFQAIAPGSPVTEAIDHLARRVAGIAAVDASSRPTLLSRLRTILRPLTEPTSAPSPSGA